MMIRCTMYGIGNLFCDLSFWIDGGGGKGLGFIFTSLCKIRT